jgi:hypothetical protein
MGTTKLTGRENLSTYACYLASRGPTDKENQVKMYKTLFYVHYIFETIRIRIRVRKWDPIPYQSKKCDPDPDRNEKPDPEPYKNVLDPQHCCKCCTHTVAAD